MASGITLKRTDDADIPTPATDKATVFLNDADGMPAVKDDAGSVTSLIGATGPGVPNGGTTGQVLAKASGTDLDTGWAGTAVGIALLGAANQAAGRAALGLGSAATAATSAFDAAGDAAAAVGAHTGDSVDAHDASAISIVDAGAFFAGSEVEAALQEAGTAIAALVAGGAGVTVDDEGSPLATVATTLNFVGAGVTATGAGATKTITIPGGGGSATAEVSAAGRVYAYSNFR